MTRIPCDSSSLISLSDNCLLRIIGNSPSKFVIPKRVKMEVFDAPFSTKRFKLRALQINSFIQKGLLEVIDDPFIYDYAERITDIANSLLHYRHDHIKIIHSGEAEVIACAKLLKENVIMMDERTTRHLIEDPEMLRKYMQSRTGLRLEIDNGAKKRIARELGDLKVIRSAEMFAYAFENRMVPYESRDALEAGLYALKFSGCSITDDEIKDYIEFLG